MQCDMCGKDSPLFKTLIEGSELNVCKACSAFGRVITPIRPKVEKKEEKKIEVKPEVIEVIIPDYGILIKGRREYMGLSQEDFAKKINEKASLIHGLETEHLKPGIALARKLERFLKIKLVEEITEMEKVPRAKRETITIGDVIKIKK